MSQALLGGCLLRKSVARGSGLEGLLWGTAEEIHGQTGYPICSWALAVGTSWHLSPDLSYIQSKVLCTPASPGEKDNWVA